MGEKRTKVTLKNTFYVPKMAFTLISANRITAAGFAIHFEDRMCKILSPAPARKIITEIPQVEGLYGKPVAQAEEAAFVGVVEESKEYQTYWPEKFQVSDEGECNVPPEALSTPSSVQHVTPAVQLPKTPPHATQPLPIPRMLRPTQVKPPPRSYKALNEGERAAIAEMDLKDDIYMPPPLPPGYLKPRDEGKVSKLLRSLYGLKQAEFEWSKELEKFFLDAEFTRSQFKAVEQFRFVDAKDTHTPMDTGAVLTDKRLAH